MNKANLISATVVIGLTTISTSRVAAQLTEFNWNNPALVGSQSWQVDGNWNMMGWPDDPGRTEPDATIIVPSEGANLSVGLTGNLTLNVGATNVTVASLKLGGTLGAVTTEITDLYVGTRYGDLETPDSQVDRANSLWGALRQLLRGPRDAAQARSQRDRVP